MGKNPRFARRFFAAGLATLFVCVALVPDTRVYAFRGHRRPAPIHHHRSHIRPLLLLGFALLTIAGVGYYYRRGIYYRHLP